MSSTLTKHKNHNQWLSEQIKWKPEGDLYLPNNAILSLGKVQTALGNN